MRYNENYVIKKTLLGRLYLANQETGDVVDVNPITVDILETIKKEQPTKEELIMKMCAEYDAAESEIRADIEEILQVFSEYNIVY